jgi:chorismate mutase
MTEDEARARLEELRVLIDDVDRRIVELLNERTRVVEEIGRVKRAEPAAHLRAEARGAGVRQRHRVERRPADADALRRIFERIIDEMRKIQRMRMEADGDK